jgi:pyruvate/2-oxoglutarate/acetoin dehydrogenase E1 component
VKGLIKAAIRDDDQMFFFQHKRLFAQTGHVPEDEYIIPIASAAVKRPGKDITILTYSLMTYLCLEAAEQLAKEEIDVEIVDLRTLKCLDFALIAESVKKTKTFLLSMKPVLLADSAQRLLPELARSYSTIWMPLS